MVAAAAEQIAAHQSAVRGVLLRLVKDQALADDLLQEALLRATRAAATLRGEASPRTWLTAVALNVARDHFRAVKRIPQLTTLDQAEHVPAAARPDHALLQGEMSDCVLDHVARLPDRQRDALLLHHFAGLCHRDIADRLGISEGHARVTLHRGQAALRLMLSRGCTLDFTDDVPCDRR